MHCAVCDVCALQLVLGQAASAQQEEVSAAVSRRLLGGAAALEHRQWAGGV
jgi:hypothetical protein